MLGRDRNACEAARSGGVVHGAPDRLPTVAAAAGASPGQDVLDSIDPRLCVPCKGARGLCGIDPCPLLARVQSHLPRIKGPGKDLFGSSPPSLFVGRHGYPQVSVGPMLPPDHREERDARLLDDPRTWLGMSIPDVVGLRSALVRTAHPVRVDRAARDPDRITRLSQELALTVRPVDVEARLARAPRFTAPAVGEFTAPHGPTVRVERAQAAENVRVERAVESVVADTDLAAAEAVVELHRRGSDGYHLERLLSAGVLGRGRRRRMVPTRWAITATDDTLGKDLRLRVLDLPTLDKPTVHFAELFGNRFHVLLLPRAWGFELVEAWLRGAFWAREPVVASDHEDHGGRSGYASETTGGYYATRLPVLEHLVQIGRQAAAVVLREITDAYTTPLGVWVVREVCRTAMASRPLVFEDVDAALRHIDRHAAHKAWRAHAPFLGRLRAQRTLADYPV